MEIPESGPSDNNNNSAAASTNSNVAEFPTPENLYRRCMRVFRWDEDFADRVIECYSQFMILKVRLQDWDATKLAALDFVSCVFSSLYAANPDLYFIIILKTIRV